MTDSLTLARKTLLEPAELDDRSLQRILSGLMKPGIDAADLYFQNSLTESWSLEDGIVKSGSHHVEQGVGVRAISGVTLAAGSTPPWPGFAPWLSLISIILT